MKNTPYPKAIARSSFSDLAKNSIADYIRELMEEDASKEEIKLPPEVRLSEELGLSRATVRQALAELENEGMIMRIHGRGTFVNPYYAKMKLWLNPGAEFGSMIRGSGYQPSIKVLRSYTIAPEQMPFEDARSSQEDFTALESVFFADGEPCIYCIDYLPVSYFTVQDDAYDFLEHFFDYLYGKAGKVCKREYIHIKSISAAELKSISGGRCPLKSPSALVHEGHFFDQNNEALFYSTAYFNTSYLALSFISNQ